jgi:hypothetical protein
MGANERTKRLIAATASILQRGEPTRFALMATCRHGLRVVMILNGASWKHADAMALQLVLAALAHLGATWPRWAEGQPEYTQEGVIKSWHTRCANCGHRLPDDHTRWCSDGCAKLWHNRIYDLDQRRDELAIRDMARLPGLLPTLRKTAAGEAPRRQSAALL